MTHDSILMTPITTRSVKYTSEKRENYEGFPNLLNLTRNVNIAACLYRTWDKKAKMCKTEVEYGDLTLMLVVLLSEPLLEGRPDLPLPCG